MLPRHEPGDAAGRTLTNGYRTSLTRLAKHRAKKVCPLHFLDVVVSHAQCKAMGRAWKGQFEGRGTRLLYLDDESLRGR